MEVFSSDKHFIWSRTEVDRESKWKSSQDFFNIDNT